MQQESKISRFWMAIQEHFLVRFLGTSFFVAVCIRLSPLPTTFFSHSFYISYLVFSIFTLLYLWLSKTPKEGLVYRIVTTFFSRLFISTVLLITFQHIARSIPGLEATTIASKTVDVALIVVAVFTGSIAFLFNMRVTEPSEDSDNIALESLPKWRFLHPINRWYEEDGKAHILLAFLLIIIGFCIRLYNLGELSLWWDELYTGTYVTRITQTGIPSFPSGLGYYWRGVAYHYLLIVFVTLFKNTEFWLRFPSVLFGMGIVTLLYSYIRKVDKTVALFVLCFLVFSSYNVEYSRFARFYVMNAFLFVLSILLFYKGFFEQKQSYKFATIGVFFIMIHTVQLSSIYLSLVAVYGIYFLKQNWTQIRTPFRIIKKNVLDLGSMVLIFLLYIINNVFERFLQPAAPYAKALDLGLTEEPRKWDFLAPPQWKLFEFFHQNYIPFAFILLSVVLTCVFFVKKEKKHPFFTFLVITTNISVFLYEIGSRGVYGPRIYLFDEALIVGASICSLFLILESIFHRRTPALLTTGMITATLLFSIQPNFYQRITVQYGDKVEKDVFRTTTVASYRADYENPERYVDARIEKDDLLINVVNVNYYYLTRSPDYVLNENVRWNTNSLLDEEGNYIVPSSKSILIHSAQELSDIIETNKDKKIWLIVNGGSLSVIGTTHIRPDFIEFLKQHTDKVVYTSPDRASRVLLF